MDDDTLEERKKLNRGRRFRVSRSRALVRDVVHYHRRIPICPHTRLCDLSDIAAARAAAPVRISWPVLFLKAFGLTAQTHPEFRQCLLPMPWLHGYEHPHSVGMLVLERVFRDERWLFWGKFPAPEWESLTDLQRRLDDYLTAPVEQVFRQQLQLSMLPTPLRRLIWSSNLSLSGKTRARRAGTFFLTTLAAKGVTIDNPPAFHTGNLTYGPLDETGQAKVTLSYDHRLTDGSLVAEVLTELERVLNDELTNELNSLSTPNTIAA